ncbi:MAG TPA: hypothetical protein DCM08_00165 [Microscillaceae bacterium]|nr:hypothetical protein [Microscillaceae bacterium]
MQPSSITNVSLPLVDTSNPLSAKTLRLQETTDIVQKWADELDTLLRHSFDNDLHDFTASLLHFLAYRCGAYRGCWFSRSEDTTATSFVLKHTFACSEKHITTPQYSLGDGLIGQAALRQEIVIFDQIQPNLSPYKAGSLSFSPQGILILPLIFGAQTLAVVELVFLQPLSDAVVLFLQRSRSNMASFLESITNLMRTKALLAETQNQKEILRAQEEELRQNLEELATTQEALKDKNTEITKAFEELAVYNNRIMQSLAYGQRMQKAVLPSSTRLTKAFKEYFHIYLPKDVVSGDFYWYAQTKEVKIFAVADCTGHGVPGGFMSMIGNMLLNQIIIGQKIHQPHEILSRLHKLIYNTLKRDENAGNEGMDIALCTLEYLPFDKVKVVFSGAKINLIYSKQGVLDQLKADRHSIGGMGLHRILEFRYQEILLNQNDCLFFATDGVLDICNDFRRKFGQTRLMAFLQEYHTLPMAEMGEKLKQILADFQGNADQRDDVTMIGIRL